MLRSFEGYLRSDLVRDVTSRVVLDSAGRIVVRSGCWAMRRSREFFDARLTKGTKRPLRPESVGQCTNRGRSAFLSPEARLAARQDERADPRPLEGACVDEKEAGVPKSQYGKAVGYALNRWPSCAGPPGAASGIDNDVAQRTMRLCHRSQNSLFVEVTAGARRLRLARHPGWCQRHGSSRLPMS